MSPLTVPPSTGRSRRSWPPASALVTGASGGIGGAVVRGLVGCGAQVLATGRSEAALAALPTRNVRTWSADLLEPGAGVRLGSHVAEVLPPLDLVVLAAGRGLAGPVADTNPRLIDEVLALDLRIPVQVVRAVLPGMLERGSGRIVLVGSVAGALAVRDEAVYAAAKAGVGAFAAALRSELAGTGVSVTLSVPGVVDTAFFARSGRTYSRRFPRPLDPDTVAAAILDAAARRRAEIWTPRWLGAVSRLRGVAPGTYHRLANASGGTSGTGSGGTSGTGSGGTSGSVPDLAGTDEA